MGPNGIEFSTVPLTYTLTISSMGSAEYTARKELEKFQQAGIAAELTCSGRSNGHCVITVDSSVEIFKAAVLTLEIYAFDHDDKFVEFSNKALELYHQLQENLIELQPKIELFKTVLLRKNQALLTINQQIKELESSLEEIKRVPLESTSPDLTAIAKQNELLAQENKKLFNKVVLAAREKSIHMNKNSYRAEMLSTAMNRVNLSNLKKYLSEYEKEQKKKSNNTLMNLGSSQKAFVYVEPDNTFLTLYQIHRYSPSNQSPNQEDVKELKNKIDMYLPRHQTASFSIKDFFKFFINRYPEKIKELEEALGRDLMRDIKLMVEQPEAVTLGEKLHQFNSRVSPLISIIHDKELTDSEKEYLLDRAAFLKSQVLKPSVEVKENNPQHPQKDKHKEDIKERAYNIEIAGGQPENNSLDLQRIWVRSPLHHATQYGTLEMVRILMGAGAYVHKKGDLYLSGISGDQVTALHIAVCIDDIGKVKLLVEEGKADVNAENKSKQTPLFAAKSKEMAEYLISQGAEINHKDSNNDTALHYAADHNNFFVVEALLVRSDLQDYVQNKKGDTALHVAAYKCFEEEVRSTSPDTDADKISNVEITRLLTDRVKATNKDLNLMNIKGHTPLHAVMVSKKENAWGNSISNRDLKVIKSKTQILCKNSADVNLCSVPKVSSYDCPVETPLESLYRERHYGKEEKFYQNRMQVADVLCHYGAKKSLKDSAILSQCAEQGDYIGLEYFITQGIALDPALFHKVMIHCSDYTFNAGGKKCIDILLEYGADPAIELPHKFNIGMGCWSRGNATEYEINLIFKELMPEAKLEEGNPRDALQKLWIERGSLEKDFITLDLTADQYAQTNVFSGSYPYPEAINYFKSKIAFSLALHKKTEVYEFLVKTEAENPSQVGVVLGEIALGFARGGHQEDAYGFLSMVRDMHPDFIRAVTINVASGFAQGGHATIAYEFLSKAKKENSQEIECILRGMAIGFAAGLHKAESKEFLAHIETEYPGQLGAVLGEAGSAYILTGKKQEAFTFLHLVQSEYPAYADSVLIEIVKTQKKRIGPLDNDFENEIIRALSMMENDEARSKMAYDLNFSWGLLKARKFNHFMKLRDINYDQLLAWSQVELPVWILQFNSFALKAGKRQSVHPDLILMIASFLVPPMRMQDWYGFSNRFAIQVNYRGSRDIFEKYSDSKDAFFNSMSVHKKLIFNSTPRLDNDEKQDSKLDQKVETNSTSSALVINVKSKPQGKA